MNHDDAAAQRGRDLAQHLWDTGTAMNRAAAAQVSVCPACAKARAKVAALEAALEECLEYFEDRYDTVDGDYGIPEANKEMRMGQAIEWALGRRPGP